MGTFGASTLFRIVGLHNQTAPIAPKLIQFCDDLLKIHNALPLLSTKLSSILTRQLKSIRFEEKGEWRLMKSMPPFFKLFFGGWVKGMSQETRSLFSLLFLRLPDPNGHRLNIIN
jgi:hypothetical protein